MQGRGGAREARWRLSLIAAVQALVARNGGARMQWLRASGAATAELGRALLFFRRPGGADSCW